MALVASSLHTHKTYMEIQYAVGLGILCIPISLYFYKKLGLMFGAFSAYSSVNAICSAMNMEARYAGYPVPIKNAVAIQSCVTALTVFVMLVAIIETPPKWIRGIRNAIPFYTVIGALHVIHGWWFNYRLPGGRGYLGFFDYCGETGVAIALGCSFLIPKRSDNPYVCYGRILGLIISVIGIALSKSAIPFGVLGLVLMFRAPRTKPWPFPAALLLGWLCVGSKIVNSSERFHAYRVFMIALWRSPFWKLGTGLGTFKVWSVNIQAQSHFMFDVAKGGWWWQWMHSDILQLWFELGAVGLVLGIMVYFWALIRTPLYREPEMFSLGLGCFGAMLFDYPLRYAVTAFFVVLFVVEGLRVD